MEAMTPNMNQKTILECKNLSKTYGREPALHGINLRLER